MIVEHEWSYAPPYSRGGALSGKRFIPAEEFLRGEAPQDAKKALSALLKLIG